MSDHDIAHLCSRSVRILSFTLEHLEEVVLRVEELGLTRSSAMFKRAVEALAQTTKEKYTARIEFLKNSLGCTESEVATALSKMPRILEISEQNLLRKIQFLVNEVGLEPQYILERLVLFTYSLEKRLVPRHHVIKVDGRIAIHAHLPLLTFGSAIELLIFDRAKPKFKLWLSMANLFELL
ncbi:transcription termination factor MTEF1, chloroplastic-like [Setaria italica]|uniref:transcription termination factor MTEF1, chloroplastic-like n=1 Tax=Setaria italica TaxID=4555 RepID=UPI0003511E77|nr:transcription termination factor MTEF1, chloroplastic-like [Setaria italica]